MSDLPDSTPESEPTAPRRPRVRHRLRTPLEARQWRRRVTGYVLFAVSVVLVVNALVGESGYLATFSGRRDQDVLRADLRRLREENKQSQEEIERLRTDPAALEDAARKGLHLGKPGEKMIIIKEPPAAKTDPAPPANPGR
jgi:cell division protein FtsB